jgi:hypothetical protein
MIFGFFFNFILYLPLKVCLFSIMWPITEILSNLDERAVLRKRDIASVPMAVCMLSLTICSYVLLDVDCPRPDDRSVMTYVSAYYQFFAKMKSEETGGRRVAKVTQT